MSAVARLNEGERVTAVWTWCPGCDSLHPFRTRSVDPALVTWEWDGNLEAPTFSPSLICYSSVHLCEGEHTFTECPDDCPEIGHAVLWWVDGTLRQYRAGEDVPAGATEARGHASPHPRNPAFGPCHSFLRAGRWEFLSDSAHHLAGQTVDMVPLPATWRES